MAKKLVKLSKVQSVLLKEIKEYNEPITSDELYSLGSFKKSSIIYALNKLIARKMVFSKRKAGEGNQLYYYIPGKKKKNKDPFNTTFDVPIKSVEPTKPIPAAPKKIITEMDIQQRCYHLLLAGRSLSSGRVADFFNVSEDQAVRLLRGLDKKYPEEIKLDILARVI